MSFEMVGLNQQQICECFNDLFLASHRVTLRGGGAEPEYFPATKAAPALIVAREDFAASALHEASHWCVAGRARRALPDYGYEYVSPPRGATGQTGFFASERRVQAVECYLSRRAGLSFRASADDPDFCLEKLNAFEQELIALAVRWEQGCHAHEAPPRAVRFGAALAVAAQRVSGGEY